MTKKVKFILSAEIVANATEGLLLGEFNNWDLENGFTMTKSKDGSLMTTVTLEEGRAYQYRYLLNDGRWVNDGSANQYIHDERFQVENCVIIVATGEEAVVAVKEAKPAKVKTVKEEKSIPAVKEKAPKKVKVAADDLTKIEGIGKKIAELLTAAEIVSFQDLSKSTPKKIKAILDAAGSKFAIHEPATWPKQAKLAAADKWDELKALQADLKGGK